MPKPVRKEIQIHKRIVYAGEHIPHARQIQTHFAGVKEVSLVGAITSFKGMAKSVKELKPDVLLLDESLFFRHPERLLWLSPLTTKTSIIALVGEEHRSLCLQLLQNKVRGIVSRHAGKEKLHSSIQEVLNGDHSISPKVVKWVIERHRHNALRATHESDEALPTFNERETHLLSLLVKDLPLKEIAEECHTTEQYIKNQLGRLYKRTNTEGREQLKKYCVANSIPLD
jgi:DNA-binding NarL/FixJ family response regulator